MGRAIHVHVHNHPTRDWEESKHPRRDNGEFGQGHGSSRKAPDPRTGPFVQHSQQKREEGKGGKSDYAKAREAEHDARRDREYAQRTAKIKQLEAHLAKAPKEDHASIKKELKQLGWKEPPKKEPERKQPAPKAEPKPEPKEAGKQPAKKQGSGPSLSGLASTASRAKRDLERAEKEEEHRA